MKTIPKLDVKDGIHLITSLNQQIHIPINDLFVFSCPPNSLPFFVYRMIEGEYEERLLAGFRTWDEAVFYIRCKRGQQAAKKFLQGFTKGKGK